MCPCAINPAPSRAPVPSTHMCTAPSTAWTTHTQTHTCTDSHPHACTHTCPHPLTDPDPRMPPHSHAPPAASTATWSAPTLLQLALTLLTTCMLPLNQHMPGSSPLPLRPHMSNFVVVTLFLFVFF